MPSKGTTVISISSVGSFSVTGHLALSLIMGSVRLLFEENATELFEITEGERVHFKQCIATSIIMIQYVMHWFGCRSHPYVASSQGQVVQIRQLNYVNYRQQQYYHMREY